jgi:DNA-binding response OmpR family regulator
MILLIDDEKRTMGSYLQELHMSGFEVKLESSVDLGLRMVEENPNEIDLLILDVMMPPGQAFAHAPTEKGLRTGVHFYDRVRKTNGRLPIMIFTNVIDDSLRRKFEQDKYCRYFQKEELLPYELAETIREILGAPNRGI